MKIPFLLLMPAVLIGCAGTPPANEASTQVSAVDPTTVCEREQITGSKFQRVSCRTATDREQDKRDAEAMADAARRTRSKESPGR